MIYERPSFLCVICIYNGIIFKLIIVILFSKSNFITNIYLTEFTYCEIISIIIKKVIYLIQYTNNYVSLT